MRGYCATCKEYRSDEGLDAWRILWDDGLPLCERCGSVVDIWKDNSDEKAATPDEEHGDAESS